jgi:hypothetical protein
LGDFFVTQLSDLDEEMMKEDIGYTETPPTKYGTVVPNSDSEATLEGAMDWIKSARHKLLHISRLIIA